MNKTRKKVRTARRRKTGLPRGKRVSPALPPNENIRKHPDEVYGDTEIPARR